MNLEQLVNHLEQISGLKVEARSYNPNYIRQSWKSKQYSSYQERYIVFNTSTNIELFEDHLFVFTMDGYCWKLSNRYSLPYFLVKVMSKINELKDY